MEKQVPFLRRKELNKIALESVLPLYAKRYTEYDQGRGMINPVKGLEMALNLKH